MTQSQVCEPNTFGKRKEPHSIVITRNGRSRHYSINPLYFSMLIGFMAMFSLGYFAATTYLVLRDDLISARGARNARMLQEYEDRITALRSNLDRITSRQLLDQQAIEAKVAELIERQKQLRGRDSAVQLMVEKARTFGLDVVKPELDQTITGSLNPEKQASIFSSFASEFSLRGLGEKQNLALAAAQSARLNALSNSTQDDFTYQANSRLFSEVAQSMRGIDADQKQIISSLRSAANDKLTKITKLMKRVGVKFPRKVPGQVKANIGGPFEPFDQSVDFSLHLEALDHSLLALQAAREKARSLPLAHPVPGKSISSRFGSRIDPFKNAYAMHSGLDFRAKSGVPVQTTANGKVIYAERKGGYGKFIEIDHGNGVTTRYAHLSRILVKKGQTVKAGAIIAKVGSTGRSSGPHLHYEVRVFGVAVNPGKYLGVGRKLAGLL